MTTILSVAKQAGVSVSTARRALSAPQLLAPKTLNRVLTAIDELGYEPNQTAGALRRGRNLSIGLIVGNILEPFFARLTRTIGRSVRAAGYTLLVAENEYEASIELQSLRQFYGQKVSGLIIRPGYGASNVDYLKRIQEQGTVILEIDYVNDDSPFSSIMLDNKVCVKQVITHLQALGHKRIAAVGRQYTYDLTEDRIHYFKATMQARGLVLPKAYDVKATTEEEAFEATLRLMALANPPTALIGVTGTCGRGVLRALHKLNIAIPEDMSFITFDNDAWTSLYPPGIDAVDQPVEAMSQAAINYVMEEIKAPQGAIIQKRYPGKLVKRGSCAATSRQAVLS